MAKLVNKAQRITTGIVYPSAGYSRVVSCIADLKAPAVQGFGHTEQVGGEVWLLGVRVWFSPHIWTSSQSVSFFILSGTGEPSSPDEIRRWENILPVMMWGRPKAPWEVMEVFHSFEWTMNRHFVGEPRRFGAFIQVAGTVPVLLMYCSFEISEG